MVGMEADDRFYKALAEGYRMEKPPLAPSSIYDLMIDCWTHESADRPRFTDLVYRIGDLMEESLRQHYLDLNLPYDRINREWLSDGKMDYLSQMGNAEFRSVSPDNNISPQEQQQHGYENVPLPPVVSEDSGYLMPIKVNMPVEYINVQHQQQKQSDKPLLANNTGYMVMNFGSHDSSLKQQTEEELTHGNHLIERPLETNAPPVTTVSSSSGYVPNDMIFPMGGNGSSSSKQLEEIIVEANIHEANKKKKTVNDDDVVDDSQCVQSDQSKAASAGAGGPKRVIVRRQKNDSGLGSIDSAHFHNNNEGGGMRVDGYSRTDYDDESSSNRSSSEQGSPTQDKPPHPPPTICLSNLSYVSHKAVMMEGGGGGGGGPQQQPIRSGSLILLQSSQV
jgi:hypothetical protein